MRPSLVMLLFAPALAVFGCKELSFPTPGGEEFLATLSGANHVPPVPTTATGTATFAVSLDTFLTYRIDVATIDSPTVAYVQEGAAGVAGAIIVTLYAGPTRNQLDFTGPLGINQFRPSTLTQLPASYGATPRERFDSLLILMRSGNVYVNVRSRLNVNGELRGQIQPQ